MGQDKGLVMFNGKPMVQYSLESVADACRYTFIVANSNRYSQYGVAVIGDVVSCKGPIGGLLTAVMHTTTDYVLLRSCDTPYITSAMVQHVIRCLDGSEAIVPLHNGKLQPMCAAYSKTLIPTLQERISTGRLRMRELIEGVATKFVDMPDGVITNVNAFANINSLSDLELNKL